MNRWRIDLAYDGTRFSGWAAQPGLRTVQGVLEEWINRILRLENLKLTVAGRTDAGVHARGQVAHFDLPAEVDASELNYRLASVLPEDITVYQISPAPDGFDARFGAVSRRYCYRVWDCLSHPDPICRIGVSKISGRLDLEKMNTAGEKLVGLHDFVAFCKFREGATSIRDLKICHACRVGPNRTVELEVTSDAFCHSMVRSLAGALIAVGLGKRPISWIDQLLAADSRQSSVLVMPPGGLTLEQVTYPNDSELAARVNQAKSMRNPKEVNPR